MRHRRQLVPCSKSGVPADIGTRLWSSADTCWSGFPLEIYRLHDRAAVGETVQASSMVALCLSGMTRMEVRIGRREEDAVSTEGALVLSGRGLEYKSFGWVGTTDVLFADLDMTRVAGAVGADLLPPEVQPLHQFMIRDSRITTLLLSMVAEAKDRCPSGALYGQALSAALAAYTYSRYAPHVRREASGAKLTSAQVARVREYVHAHLSDDISLRDLAAVVQLSASRFSEVFKNTFSCAPHQYVIGRRIAEARRLLSQAAMPIAGIALMTGFADQSHFTKMFRKVTQITPRQYQLMQRGAPQPAL